MEDAATAEISRSQVWQWVHNGVTLDTGRTVTADLVRGIAAEELAAIAAELGEKAYAASRFELARAACSSRSRWPTTSPTSSPCPPTRRPSTRS